MGIKAQLRQLAPRSLLGVYHAVASYLVALVYGFPARKLIVVGVTGTKGKTTTCAMIHHLLSSTGYKTGLISTAQFKIGEKQWLNDLKMTMPGRGALQRLFRDMVHAGCTHVVVETSSEGLAQWRHLGIPYQVAVFTNMAPEHIEAHGSFAAYRAAKARLFKACARHGGTSVVNLDDTEAGYFLQLNPGRTIGYTMTGKNLAQAEVLSASELHENATTVHFRVNDVVTELPVGGTFNVANALASLGAAKALGIKLESATQSLASFPGTPGRLEFISAGQPFRVVVDYAHTPESLQALYKTLSATSSLIAVLGSCGGGRDKAKRPVLGKLAGEHARAVFVTDEDPYDEDPCSIMDAVAVGVREVGKKDGVDLWIEPDRRSAIRRAFGLAKPGDTVVITGKGSEQWLCAAGGKMIPWDDRNVVREELLKLL